MRTNVRSKEIAGAAGQYIPGARAIAEATGNDPDRAAPWAAVWMVFQACVTWRDDSDDVQAWVVGDECRRLLWA